MARRTRRVKNGSTVKRRRRAGRRFEALFSLPPFKVLSAALNAENTMWGEQLLRIPQLWTFSRGEGVLVGVVDSGMALQHPDLKDAIVDSRDFTGSASGVADDIGHGTHVAGIIAAAQNGRGIVGVAPGARLLNAKAINSRGDVADEQRVADAVAWCFQRGAHLVNLSLGSRQPAPRLQQVIQQGLGGTTPRFVICAAGNTGPNEDDVEYPARYPESIAVGYVSLVQGGVAPGFDTARGVQVMLVAPGGAITSTYPPDSYAVASGTSMAAPFVTGVAALMLSYRMRRGKQPLSLARLTTLLTAGATDLYLKGRDRLTGFGLINPQRVLTDAAAD